jgi:SHS2 domain-containing protein
VAGWFKHLPHTADVLIEAWGESLEEAFEYAALGMTEVMTDLSSVRPLEEVELAAEGFDLESLLYDWIEKLIVLFDSRQLLVSKVKVEGIKVDPNGKYRLKARVWGEPYDPERHESRALVKAMTYHMMEIRKEDGAYRVRFVVDI